MTDTTPQNDLIVVQVEGENRIDSRVVAKELGIEHEVFMRTCSKYRMELEDLGQLCFQNVVGYRAQGGGNPQKYIMLNEDQSIFAATLSRNSKEVVAFKLKLTKAFSSARELLTEVTTSKGFTNKLLIDRIRLFNSKNNITSRKFCIFQEVAWDFFSAEMRGSTLPEGAVPDGSVGRRWSDNIKAKGYDMSLVMQYPHHYPDQRKTRFASLYPIEWLPDFKIWFREVYLPVYFPLYLRDSLNVKGPEVKQILVAFRVVERIGN